MSMSAITPPPTPPTPFTLTGADLRRWRLHFGQTQAQLARALDFHPDTIRHWEARGAAPLPHARYQLLLNHFTLLLDQEEQQRGQAQRLAAALRFANPAC